MFQDELISFLDRHKGYCSAVELAKAAGVGKNTIYRLRNGEGITIKNWEKIKLAMDRIEARAS